MKVRGAALRRSRTNRIVAGVCGGLGRLFWCGPVLVSTGFPDRHAPRWCAWSGSLFDHVVDRANGIEV